MRAQHREKYAGDLRAIVSYYIRWYLVWDNTIAKEYIRHICGRSVACCNFPCSFGIPVDIRNDIWVSFGCLGVFGRGLKISIGTTSNGPVARNG